MSVTREVTIGNRTIKFEFQKYAKQANGSVMVSWGGTQVLVTACAQETASPDVDFFPLGVDYIEKFYASGRIPGGYGKREAKPSDAATLTARVVDRPLRPCFPEGYRNETVITATVVSYEHGFSPVPLATIGASTALMISEIPFNGPVAALRIGRKDGEYVLDPLEGTENDLDLDLNIACKPDAVLMVEAGARFISEEDMLNAIEYAHELMQPIFAMQEEIREAIGKEKWVVIEKDPAAQALYAQMKEIAHADLAQAFRIKEKKERGKAIDLIGKSLFERLGLLEDISKKTLISSVFKHLKSDVMREQILEEKLRIDGRGPEDIRPIACESAPLHKAHGSALFTRGETQALGVVTLGSAEDMQRSESLWDFDMRENFLLHYNFPPFCVGEARMQRAPGRREVGHGNLARRALVPILPKLEEFNYTIRLVSEVLESNGSSSMATVCAGNLALLAAGVPIKENVAGIAMGLIKGNEHSVVLSDILGDEDHLGDMDFKVCGNERGLTALQMDIKISGLSKEIFREALAQARRGLLHILGKMSDCQKTPGEVSDVAPKIFKIKISPDRNRDLIGPGGRTIKRIVSLTGAKVDLDDSGTVSVLAKDSASAQKAKALVRAYASAPKVGNVFLGKVTRVSEFGVFAEIKPGLEGMCHISHFDKERVESLDEVVKVGQEILVKVIDVDKQGRIKLSRREALGEKPTFFDGVL